MGKRFDRLAMPDGHRAPIHAEIVDLYHAPLGEKVEAESAIESSGRGRKTFGAYGDRRGSWCPTRWNLRHGKAAVSAP